jgi:hypothetical protein
MIRERFGQLTLHGAFSAASEDQRCGFLTAALD